MPQTPVQDDTIFPHLFHEQARDLGGAHAALYERGLFQLNDPISRVIPQWRDMMVYSGHGRKS